LPVRNHLSRDKKILMNNLRNVLCVLMAIALATLALPSSADNGKKRFSLSMAIVSAPPAPTPPPFTVTATVTNEGNSTINSFSLSVTGLIIVGVNPPASGTAAGPFPGSSVSVTKMHPLKSGDSLTLTLQVSSCGDGAWGASAWTGSSQNGQTFDLVPADSTLATPIPCGDLASNAQFSVPDSLNPNCVTGQRGFYDKDGSIPAGAVPYFVTNLPSADQRHFRWPDFQAGGDPLATFRYTICGTGPLPELTEVAWLNMDGSPASTRGTPAYITAQDCLENANFLPAPYGTLQADNGGTITVDTTIPGGANGVIVPPALPFDIVIGTERLTVTACAEGDEDEGIDQECGEQANEPETWSVTRAVGNTTQVTHTGGLVMSTPLPLLPENVGAPYTAGNQAQMCIAGQQGEDEGGNHSTTFIDIGDGWVNHP
jgi:hypothetical protein